MKEPKSNGLQKRIDFFGRWALAFFTVLIVISGWLGGRYEAEQFDTLFKYGIGCAIFFGVVSGAFAVATYHFITRLEALEND